jgi:serine/threonine-protein kinase HipA
MSQRAAVVWCAEERVGVLREEVNRMRFTYDEAWRRHGFPISLGLALSAEEHDAHSFFAGLLPEAQARHRVCREFRLPDDDDFGLLLAIGRDCAGVLSVLRPGEEPAMARAPLPLDAEALSQAIASRGAAVPVAMEWQRFSLAGAQDKLAVRIEGEVMWLPDQLRPSTHILKFETHARVCLAEYLATELARRAGFDVGSTSYLEHENGFPYLLVARYDREVTSSGLLVRLHQEDMAQALGYPSSRKYEEDGGPSLTDIATLLRQRTAEPIRDVARLRDWQLFNYFVGNYDGHAKNLALLYRRGSTVPVLAPFYDLVALEFLYRIGIRYARKLAFLVGGRSVPEEIRRRDWEGFARQLGIPPKRLLLRVSELALRLPALAQETRAAFAARFGDNQVLDRFEETIRDRCRWTLGSMGTS